MDSQAKGSLTIVFITVFLDLVGFGIIIPLIPYLAREFSASPVEIGWLMAIFSIMQFLFSPLWGKLSDRVGRRPIILMSLFGASFAYILFAFAQSLTFLFLARGLAGFFAANLSVAQACIADITPKEKRSANMGLIGAAFGLGFIMGPVIAGLTGPMGEALGSEPPFGIQFSALVAAGLNGLNGILAFFILPETIHHLKGERRKKYGTLESFSFVFKDPLLRPLFLIFFLINLGMALTEVMTFPFVQDRFQWSYSLASISFAYVGVVMVFTQGYLIRRWIPRFGEKKILRFGLWAMTLAFVGIGFSHHIPFLALAMTFLALGNGCVRPPVLGMASVIAHEEQQGYILGVMTSIGAIGRILGPPMGGWFYGEWSQGSPFFVAGGLGLGAVILFALVVQALPESQSKENST